MPFHIFYLLIVSLYVCECVLMCTPMWMSKKNFGKWVLSFNHKCLRDWTQILCPWTWLLVPLWAEQLISSNRHGFDIWDLCWFSILHNLRVNVMTERKISLHSPSHKRLLDRVPDRQKNSLQTVILLTLHPSVISTHLCDTLTVLAMGACSADDYIQYLQGSNYIFPPQKSIKSIEQFILQL